MSGYFPMEGELKTGDFFSLLYHIYKYSVSGVLQVRSNGYQKEMVIEDRKIVFATSTRKEDSFGDYLLNNEIINQAMYQRTSNHMKEKSIRFGRALVELGYLDYDRIWESVQNHLQSIVFSFFTLEQGHYRIITDGSREIENISLDMDILSVILNGVRKLKSKDYLIDRFKEINNLFVLNHKTLSLLNLKPYELHVFELVQRNSRLSEILRRSELLEFDTMRLLFVFWLMEIISPRRAQTPEPDFLPEDSIPGSSRFTSFEEALKHYNIKFELIFKTLCKEIGPIALSLLTKAVDDILDTLPAYFKKMHMNSDGKIDEESFLKALWYFDFGRNVTDFLQGLEEILYTEVYTVKKHLGRDYEQQVLKWINGVGY